MHLLLPSVGHIKLNLKSLLVLYFHNKGPFVIFLFLVPLRWCIMRRPSTTWIQSNISFFLRIYAAVVEFKWCYLWCGSLHIILIMCGEDRWQRGFVPCIVIGFHALVKSWVTRREWRQSGSVESCVHWLKRNVKSAILDRGLIIRRTEVSISGTSFIKDNLLFTGGIDWLVQLISPLWAQIAFILNELPVAPLLNDLNDHCLNILQILSSDLLPAFELDLDLLPSPLGYGIPLLLLKVTFHLRD